MKTREWMPEDNDVLLGWMREHPELIVQMGFPEDKSLQDVHLALLESALNPTHVRLAVEEDDEVVAFAAVTSVNGNGTGTVHIAVPPSRRGRAKWYALSAESFLKERGFKTLIACIPKGRNDVESFARSLGFQHPSETIMIKKLEGD